MLKFWIRLYKDNRLLNDFVCDSDFSFTPEQILEEGLKQACYSLDIPNPIILKKHVADIKEYSLTRFLPGDFPESVEFEKAEVNVFDDSKNKKRIY